MKLIGTAIDQKRTGEDESHRVGCRTAMWKERRNQHIMISKQHQSTSILMNPFGTKFSGDKIDPSPISGRGERQIESSRKKLIESQHGMYSH